ncbi:MAG: gliding motility-associated C-terminal domain-containing protein [Flavobacteriales bacterium]
MRLTAFLALFPLTATVSWAQPPNSDCSTAATLCAEQQAGGDNTGAVGLPGFCASTANLVWYTFTTNSVGGQVNVQLTSINCPLIAGMDNELSVVVLSGDGSCLPGSFASVSPCVQDSESFSFNTLALAPNTQYWIIVAGAQDNGSTIAAQCGFQIEIGGAGADIVGVDFDAGPDVEISEGASTQLNAIGGTNYDWSPTSGLSGNGIPDPIAQPVSSTTYTVTTQINGCAFSDDVTVEVILLIQPTNTFSPNDDGINDTWDVPGIVDYPGSEVLIYDRWGQRVFRSNGYREPWDGTNNGHKVTEGTYYYYIQLNQVEGQSTPYTGFISIIR